MVPSRYRGGFRAPTAAAIPMRQLRWLAVLGTAGMLWAQQPPGAVLQLVVRDAATAQPLSGATVRLQGTVLGGISRRDGTVRLERIPAGEYALVVSMVGYRVWQRTLRLQAGDTVRVLVELEPQPVGLVPIVVTAAKRAQTLQEAPVSISAVELAPVLERSYSKLDEVLRTIPGVTVNRDHVSIRGSSGFALGVGSRTLLLLDGIPLLSGDSGEMKFDALPLMAAERIEVLKGAASALYGTAALGGVINVITREPSEQPQGAFRLYGGVYGTPRFEQWRIGRRGFWGADLRYTQRLGPVALLSSATVVRDESYRLDDDSFRWQLFSKLTWRVSPPTALTVLLQHADDDHGNWLYWRSLQEATRPGNSDSPQRVRSWKSLLAAEWRQFWSTRLNSTLRTGVYRTEFRNRLPGAPDTLPASVAYSLSAEWQWGWQWQPNALLTSGVHSIGNVVEAPIYGERRQWLLAAYVQAELGMLRPLGITAGARLDWERTQGAAEHLELSPRLGIVYASWFGPQFRFALGRAFRAPTVAERFAQLRTAGFVVRPNPQLKAERGWSAELGAADTLRFAGKPWAVDVAVFHSDLFDLIEPGFGQDAAIQFRNVTRARVQGVELNATGWVGPSLWANQPGALRCELALTLLNPRDLSANSVLKYRSRWLGIARGMLPLGFGELHLEYRYQSRVERIDEEFSTLGLIRHADQRVPIHVVELRWTLEGMALVGLPVQLSLGVRNAFDYYYTEVPGNLAAPRQFVLQLSGGW